DGRRVDGYYESESADGIQRYALQFPECFWHGCPTCFQVNRDRTLSSTNRGDTIDARYERTRLIIDISSTKTGIPRYREIGGPKFYAYIVRTPEGRLHEVCKAKRGNWNDKRKLLVQRGGFLPYIIGLILSTLLSLIIEGTK
ncbi:hypothetical protein ALC57_13284, partial [Trachymyrmex cornetzi]